MAVDILVALTSTLELLRLDDPARVARQLATILGPQVYDALNGTKAVRSSEPVPSVPEGHLWDPNVTLLGLASRVSPHPLRAWLDIAIAQRILDADEAAIFERELRDRFAPDGTSARVFEKALATPFTPISHFGLQETVSPDGSRSPRLPQVCVQCRKDHQRCEQRGEKPCKRCQDHGWGCAFYVSPRRNGRGFDPKMSKRRRLQAAEGTPTVDDDMHVEGSDDDSAPPPKPMPLPSKRKARQPARRCHQCADSHSGCQLIDNEVACKKCFAEDLPCSFIAAAARRRSSTPHSTKADTHHRHGRAPSREVDQLSKDFYAVSRNKAIDEALAELGMRKTPANVAFLKDAGLIPGDAALAAAAAVKEEEESEAEADEAGDEMEVDELPPARREDAEANVAAPSRSPKRRKSSQEEDEDDVASVDGSASEFSFFADTTAGTPATVAEPQFIIDSQQPPTASTSTHHRSFSLTIDPLAPSQLPEKIHDQ